MDVEVAIRYICRISASLKHIRSLTEGEARRVDFPLKDLYHGAISDRSTRRAWLCRSIPLHHENMYAGWFEPFSGAVNRNYGHREEGKEIRT